MAFIFVLIGVSLSISCYAARFRQELSVNHFLKGNLHTHSTVSDGDSSPRKVVEWYRDNGYHFLSLTDHNVRVNPEELDQWAGTTMTIVPGEEVSYAARTSTGFTSVHGNSFCANRTIGGEVGTDITGLLERMATRVYSAGGIWQVNHPNFEWALNESNFAGLGSGSIAATGFLMEVANQHPFVNNNGSRDRLSTEQLWDRLLNSGKVVYGTATDDMHDLTGHPGFTPRRPGKGWVRVFSENNDSAKPSASFICEQLSAGRFYFSTGLELSSLVLSNKLLELTLSTDSFKDNKSFAVTVVADGRVVLQEVRAVMGENKIGIHLDNLNFSSTRKYLRVSVQLHDGTQLWTQPFFVNP